MLATSLERAERMIPRMRGLLGRASLAEGQALWITPCASVHTAGMRFAIDVAFLDASGRVLRRYDALRPWRGTRLVRGAVGALELPAGTLARTDTRVGDVLDLGS